MNKKKKIIIEINKNIWDKKESCKCCEQDDYDKFKFYIKQFL